MNRNKIKKFAIEARLQLKKQISEKCNEYGIYKHDQGILIMPVHNLSKEENKQRQSLMMKIDDTSYDQVIEEVAYVWFNRFIALRYMEVNGYLPYGMNIFTNQNNEFKPEIIDRAMDLKLKELNDQKIYDYVLSNQNDQLYRYLLIGICNDMNQYLPALFKKLKDEMILLLPDHLLSEDSVISKMIKMIKKEAFFDQVEIIGWLYQYYNSEIKDQVIDINNASVKKSDIPIATQVFTPDWIVRYIVDNSLGTYYLERNLDSKLKNDLTYHISIETNKQTKIDMKTLKVLDPCMGSGHILVYAFEVLLKMYLEQGYSQQEAVESILKYNLYGFDIDKRAFQLAYFALMMKARKYHDQILQLNPILNIIELKESDVISDYFIKKFASNQKLYDELIQLKQMFKDSKEIGSILELEHIDIEKIRLQQMIYEKNHKEEIKFHKEYERLIHLFKQYELMSAKYPIVVTNPPYMNKYEGSLRAYILQHYKDVSGDMFSIFMYKNTKYATDEGYCGFMTPFVWMFLKTYEKLRKYICEKKSIVSLIQLEYAAFKEARVPICCFVLSNELNRKGTFIRLSEFSGGMEVQKQKLLEAITDEQCSYRYLKNSSNFSLLENYALVYWMDDVFIQLLKQEQTLKTVANPCVGLQSGNNERFLRYWYEVDYDQIAFHSEKDKTYYLYNKGGNYRKWYGNEEYVINYKNDGEALKKAEGSVIRNPHTYFKEHITWSKVSSGKIAFRYKNSNHLYDVAGTSIFSDDHSLLLYLLGLLNSNVIDTLLSVLSPTMNYEVGQIASLPIVIDANKQKQIVSFVEECILLSKNDYDDYETSYDFNTHPLIRLNDHSKTIKDLYEEYKQICVLRFESLKAKEQSINELCNEIYQVQAKVDTKVEAKTIKMTIPNEEMVIKSLISYIVGWMFERFSIDVEGIRKSHEVKLFTVDEIVEGIEQFVEKVFGVEHYIENMIYIHEILGGEINFEEDLRKYFINDFYKDHCRMYNKRPIYWMFDSGKKHGFTAFACIHSFNETLYDLLDGKISEVVYNNDFDSHTLSEVKNYDQVFKTYSKNQFQIDLNEGILQNYKKFDTLLRKIGK